MFERSWLPVLDGAFERYRYHASLDKRASPVMPACRFSKSNLAGSRYRAELLNLVCPSVPLTCFVSSSRVRLLSSRSSSECSFRFGVGNRAAIVLPSRQLSLRHILLTHVCRRTPKPRAPTDCGTAIDWCRRLFGHLCDLLRVSSDV